MQHRVVGTVVGHTVVDGRAALLVSATDPFASPGPATAMPDSSVATSAIAVLDTAGRWHPDYAADVLDALDRSGATSTNSERFADWASRATGQQHTPVPFGRAVLTVRQHGPTRVFSLESGRRTFTITADNDATSVIVAEVDTTGRPLPGSTRTVPGGPADGLAWATTTGTAQFGLPSPPAYTPAASR